MSVFHTPVLAGASGNQGTYEIEQSLRFDSGGNSVLTRNLTTQGNRTTWTFSGWFKRTKFGEEHTLWSAAPGAHASNSSITYLDFNDADKLIAYSYHDSAERFRLKSTAVFRDPSAWYHIVWRHDTTLSTADDRIRLYVNGVQLTDFDQRTNPGSSYESKINDTIDHTLGEEAVRDRYNYNGYMAEVNFIDGSALGPESFGELDANGIWRPIEYAGSYTGQSFYLKFDAADVDGDSSGLGNDFTASGITASGTGTDVMSDTPTKNWATLSPLGSSFQSRHTLSEGNLTYTQSANSGQAATMNSQSTIGVSSGKWYWEVSGATNQAIGFGENLHEVGSYNSSGAALYSGGFNAFGSEITAPSGTPSFGSSDTIGFALDLDDDNDCVVYKNGTSIGTFTTIPSRTWFPTGYVNSSGSSGGATFNFGQREFANPPGTIGATDYFNTIIWTGDGSNPRTLTGVGFQSDLVWIKGRSVGGDLSHQLFDSVRGLSGGNSLQPDRNVAEGAEGTGNGYLSAFTSDGFTVDTTSSDIYVNDSGKTYVAWCWKAGGTAVSNTDGSITSQVSANNNAGFSIVTWTGTGANGDYGHGLDGVPAMIFHKRRDSTSNWHVWHKGLPTDNPTNDVIYLDLPDGENGGNNNVFRQDPTDTLIYTGSAGSHNTLDATYVDYVWTEKTGVSKFGSYEGNGSSDGPVISCGFRPAMIMIKWAKDVSTSESWQIYDNKRGGNPNNTVLAPDAPAQEESPSDRYIQFTEDGFQLKANGQQINRSGAKYIFAAWAATFTGSDEYKSLNTANLPAPEVKNPSKNFNSTLYTGVTGSQNVSAGMAPDLAWIKKYSSGSEQSHSLTDRVRGNDLVLQMNETGAETSGDIDLTSTGVTIGNDNALRGANGVSYVLWTWLAGGSGSADTSGTIDCTLSANATAGCSIIKYSGTGAQGTLPHGLGVAPSFVILKNIDQTSNWTAYHSELGVSHTTYPNWIYPHLGFAEQSSSNSVNHPFYQRPDNSFLYLNTGTSEESNVDGEDHIAYCFAEVDGFFKVGSYQGTGDSFDRFIYCGFKPALIVIKSSSTSSRRWEVFDSGVNDDRNPSTTRITWSAADVATDYSTPDFLSNGFNLKGAAGYTNDSGEDYIWLAWAENPFGGDGVSPTTAR